MVTISDAVVRKNTVTECDELQISELVGFAEDEIYLSAGLEFSGVYQYYNASFFSRPLTRSLPPWAAVDPDRRLNNP
ncbi:hypothetical protein NFJ77_02715 [Escherichia coli]|nr:hypothetical protein NFJ77_02715 [Escherichia coli]